MSDDLIRHGGKLLPKDQLVMCSRCPLAMYAVLARHADGSVSVIFYCESCDR